MADATRSEADPCGDVCSLPADDLRTRLAWLRSEIHPHVRGALELADGRAFEFSDGAEMRERLERLVEVERRCCAGLGFGVERDLERGVLRLEVRGADAEIWARIAMAGIGEPSPAP